MMLVYAAPYVRLIIVTHQVHHSNSDFGIVYGLMRSGLGTCSEVGTKAVPALVSIGKASG